MDARFVAGMALGLLLSPSKVRDLLLSLADDGVRDWWLSKPGAEEPVLRFRVGPVTEQSDRSQ